MDHTSPHSRIRISKLVSDLHVLGQDGLGFVGGHCDEPEESQIVLERSIPALL